MITNKGIYFAISTGVVTAQTQTDKASHLQFIFNSSDEMRSFNKKIEDTALADQNKEIKIRQVVNNMSVGELRAAAILRDLNNFKEITKSDTYAKVITSEFLPILNHTILIASGATWVTSAVAKENELSSLTNIVAGSLAISSALLTPCLDYLSRDIHIKQNAIENRCQALALLRYDYIDKNHDIKLPLPPQVNDSEVGEGTSLLPSGMHY
ncbi:hypothetical protein [Pantoea cypripedii]|uniref:Uncharacterized protein n=1 Tax=Pantoea cypripedii TaxID=55209 RepID=A0A6B9G7P5_PANCY|nr:hypothetical protein [Pantoea cypripedii]QGY30117.1 hypothetical protein CUN67_14760 [Pantoea cypripedii]